MLSMDAAYFYKWSGLVCACLLVMTVSPAETAQLIEPLGQLHVNQSSRVLDGVLHWRHLANLMRLQLCSLLLPLVVLERAIKQVCVCVSFPICTYCLQPAIADGVTLLLSSADRRHWSQLCRDVDERLWRISPSSWPGVDIHVQPHTIIEPSSRSVLFRSQGNFVGFSLTQLFCGLCVCYYLLLFRECCSRCRFQPYDCVVILFVEQIQSTFKFC